MKEKNIPICTGIKNLEKLKISIHSARFLCGLYVRKDVVGGMLALLNFRESLFKLSALGLCKFLFCNLIFVFLDMVQERTLTLSSFAFTNIFVYAQTKRIDNKAPYQLREEFERKICSRGAVGG